MWFAGHAATLAARLNVASNGTRPGNQGLYMYRSTQSMPLPDWIHDEGTGDGLDVNEADADGDAQDRMKFVSVSCIVILDAHAAGSECGAEEKGDS